MVVQECARYLETYKAYETKPADIILGRTEEDYFSRLTAAVTSIRGVNRTDVLTLATQFRTAAGIMKASAEELAACPGIGPTKVALLPQYPEQLSYACSSCRGSASMICVVISCL